MLVRAGMCALALLAVAPSAAAAQFTTVVRPPERREAAPIAPAEQARRDSVTTLQIASMQEWVDSVAAQSAAAGDTLVTTESAGAVETDSAAVTAAAPREATARYANGAPAPDTATPLPMLLLAGLLATAVGGVLLHRPRA